MDKCDRLRFTAGHVENNLALEQNKSKHPPLKAAVSRRLRCDAVGVGVRHGCSTASRALCQHQSGTTKNRRVVLLLLLAGLAGFTLLIIALQHLNGRCLLAHEIDHEWHREIRKSVAP